MVVLATRLITILEKMKLLVFNVVYAESSGLVAITIDFPSSLLVMLHHVSLMLCNR